MFYVTLADPASNWQNANPGGFIWVVGMLLLIWLTMRIGRRRQAAPTTRDAAGMGQFDRAELSRLKEVLDRSMVECHSQFREMAALLTTKTEVLDRLIIEADKRLEALKRAGLADPAIRADGTGGREGRTP